MKGLEFNIMILNEFLVSLIRSRLFRSAGFLLICLFINTCHLFGQDCKVISNNTVSEDIPREHLQYLAETDDELIVLEERKLRKGVLPAAHIVLRAFDKSTMTETKSLFATDILTNNVFVGAAYLKEKIALVYRDYELERVSIRWISKLFVQEPSEEMAFDLKGVSDDDIELQFTNRQDGQAFGIVLIKKMGVKNYQVSTRIYTEPNEVSYEGNFISKTNLLSYTELNAFVLQNGRMALMMEIRNSARDERLYPEVGMHILIFEKDKEPVLTRIANNEYCSSFPKYVLHQKKLFFGGARLYGKSPKVYTGYINLDDVNDRIIGSSVFPPLVHAQMKSIKKAEKYYEKAVKGKNYFSDGVLLKGISVSEKGNIVFSLNEEKRTAASDDKYNYEYRYLFKNILVSSVQPDGTFNWFKVIERRVFIPNTHFRPPYFNHVAVANSNRVFLLVNEPFESFKTKDLEIGTTKTSSVQLVQIDEDGQWVSHPVLGENMTKGIDFRMIGYKAYNLSNNTLVFPGTYTNLSYFKLVF